MANLRIPGAYEVGDDAEDGILSEDEYGFSTLDHDGGDNSASIPCSYIHDSSASHPEGNVFGNREFHPTAEDIAFVRSIFPLPPELITQILDLAECWAHSESTYSKLATFHDADTRYLQSKPIQGGDFKHPLRRVLITTESKDQGWSSYPEHHGTRENSWTWFELTLDDGQTDHEIVRVEIMRNIHAGSTFEEHRAVIEDERILKQARKGDRLSVWARAMYPGWGNKVRSAKIEVWVAC